METSSEEKDTKLLNVWQTFQFKHEDSESSLWIRSESARSLMFQTEMLFQRGCLGETEYLDLLNTHEKNYSDLVDQQNESEGLNNYAEQSIGLRSEGFRNDSENWESSLTFESLDDLNISTKPAKDCKLPVKLVANIESKNTSCQSKIQSEPQGIKMNAIPIRSDMHFDNTIKANTGLFSEPNNQRNQIFVDVRTNRKQDDEAAITRDDDDVMGFKTAKQQYIMNERKRKASNGGLSLANYGATNSKKSLGYRRGPSTRFIPPVRNNDKEEEYERKEMKRSQRQQGYSTSEPEDEFDERLKGIDPKMVELINNEIMDHGPPVDWDDIAGLEFAKTVIKEIVVWPMLRPDIFKGLRGPPRGLLLFGPPGTGKTLIGKCIASQSKATFFSISASSLTSKWIGEGEKMVRALFAVARCHQPAVIFIDEIDSLLSQRSDSEHESSRRIKTEFLIQLDGATSSNEDRLLVVGATNRPQEIDEAARRRLVKRLYIPLPEGDARKQIICNLLKDQHYSLSDDDFQQLIIQSQGYSGSDMSNLCREAALGPIRSISGSIQAITPDQVRPIVFADFEKAFRQVRASVSTQDLSLYQTWNKQFGSGY